MRQQKERVRDLYELGMERDDGYATLQFSVDYLYATCGEQNRERALHFLTMAGEWVRNPRPSGSASFCKRIRNSGDIEVCVEAAKEQRCGGL